MAILQSTHILRLTHINNLPILLQRGGLHAPNTAPNDGLIYKTIHNLGIQAQRRVQRIPCKPGGVIHDYVLFYFGERLPMLGAYQVGGNCRTAPSGTRLATRCRSANACRSYKTRPQIDIHPPMLYQLHTGQVMGYNEGEEPLIYLVSSAQRVQRQNIPFVFSGGHGIAAFTKWFAALADLDKVDWEVVNATYWRDTAEDMDRQRRKQAEFLIHRFCPWSLLGGIAVCDEQRKAQVEAIFQNFPAPMRFPVKVRRDWYYTAVGHNL